MKILNFGSCNIDYVYSVAHIVHAGETIPADKMELFPGGKGLNQSIALARAGAKVYHAGCIGNDGGMLREVLKESGADVSFLRTMDTKNGHAVIQVDHSGENSIFVYKGTNGMLDTMFIDSVLDRFSAGDILLLQNEINLLSYIIEKAAGKGMQIVLNPSPFTEELKKIDLHRISYLILNETEGKGFSGTENAKECIAYMQKCYPHLKVVLTLGKKGCIYADSEKTLSHPAFSVKVVDTTAAGDTFTGYFVARIAVGKSYGDAIRLAGAASAVAVSRMGAAPSIPKIEEVEAALKTLKPYVAENKRENHRTEILQYIEENRTDACLEELARRFGYTPSYMGTYAKEILGEPFSLLLQKKRCMAAAQMLLETDMPISEIINAVGYENESFFRNKFKELYGQTPFEFRKQGKEGNKNDRGTKNRKS